MIPGRAAMLAGLLLPALWASGQRIDSVRVFRQVPAQAWTTSTAESAGWRLWRSHAATVQAAADDLAELNAVLGNMRPVKHHHARLPELSHLGFAYVGRALHVFCLVGDAERVIDLTARQEFTIADWTDRLKVRAWLLSMGL